VLYLSRKRVQRYDFSIEQLALDVENMPMIKVF